MGCSSGPNFNKPSLVYSLDATTPVGYDASANTIRDRCGRRRRRKRRKSSIHGSAARNKNKGRGAFSLNGTSQYLSIPIDNDDDISAFTTFTVCAWIYPTTSANFWIVSKGINGDDDDDTEFGVYLNSDGKAEVQIYDESEEKFTKSTCANALAANKWHFVSATFDGTNLQVAANIIDKGASQVSTVVIENTDTQLYIGRSHGTDATDFAAGFIGMVKIYDDKLSDDDIYNIYRSKIKKFGAELATPAAGTGTGEEDTAGPSGPFLQFTQPTVSSQITLDLSSSTNLNIQVDWGDGSSITTITDHTDSNKTHTYSTAGDKTVKVYGTTGFNEVFDGNNVKAIDAIGNWLSTRNSFNRLFSNNSSINSSDMANWDTSNIIIFNVLFLNATAFNVNIGSWDTASVTNFARCFYNADSFNQDIGSWDVSAGANFTQMFRNNSGFQNGGNNNINNWTFKSTGTINFRHMFRNSHFNRNIGSWNTGQVTNMRDMFRDARNFDQDISNWDFTGISSDDNLRNFFSGNAELDEDNYDPLLIRWSQQASNMPNNINVNMGDSEYDSNAAASARSTLINTYGWTINDGGRK